jgi:Fur family transcriptional regulator, ferric uptake regulator
VSSVGGVTGTASGAPLGPSVPGPTSVDGVLALVRAGGGRATASRRVLLEILFESSDHRSAEDLAAAVQARSPEVHLSTIYRNLDELERLGVIVHTHLGHGPATYQLAGAAHSHLICERCGRRFEAPEELFAGLAHEASARYGFTIDPRHFAILGRCADCQVQAAGDGG